MAKSQWKHGRKSVESRRKVRGITEESQWNHGGKSVEPRGKVSGTTEESQWNHGGKSGESRRKVRGITEKSQGNHRRKSVEPRRKVRGITEGRTVWKIVGKMQQKYSLNAPGPFLTDHLPKKKKWITLKWSEVFQKTKKKSTVFGRKGIYLVTIDGSVTGFVEP